MYNIDNFPQIRYHLKNISSIFDDKGNHFAIFCPFCNDSTRKPDPNHGHCYISKELPVYYCHRCDSAGTILKLLISTDFDDIDTINQLKSFVKFNFVKDHLYQKPKHKVDYYDTINFIKRKIFNIDNQELEKFNNYVKIRLGNINYSKFLIYPDYLKPYKNLSYDLLTVCFNNRANNFIEGRFVNPINNLRYKRNEKAIYYFQKWDFEAIENIIITEGVFDLLNIYIYNNMFNNSFYLSMSGKRYLSILEQILYQELLFKSCRVNLVFDNDNKYIERTLWKCRLLVKDINNDIEVVGWKPNYLFKDAGQYPLLTKV